MEAIKEKIEEIILKLKPAHDPKEIADVLDTTISSFIDNGKVPSRDEVLSHCFVNYISKYGHDILLYKDFKNSIELLQKEGIINVQDGNVVGYNREKNGSKI